MLGALMLKIEIACVLQDRVARQVRLLETGNALEGTRREYVGARKQQNGGHGSQMVDVTNPMA